MGCLQALAGLKYDRCTSAMGGIETVYVANWENLSGGVEVDSANKFLASSITMSGSTKFYAYHFREETGSLTSTLTANDNGGSYYTHVLSLVFDGMDANKHLELEALTKDPVAVIAKDNQGKYWLMSKDRPAYGSDATDETGTSTDDHNGYQLSITVKSPGKTIEVPASLMADIIEEPAN